ncbi:MAG TPA: ABC transporter ATP-binding protein [Acetobacteraceae bacterium]|jgi:oligopeptide/dipeptide ABC transporter ATP-binding protein|nr:ABC transporter ATP-binding protein [Acetobacteraceae bacterium]
MSTTAPAESLLRVDALQVTYGPPSHLVHAVADATLMVEAGEAVGLAGESGCGKSTLARALLGLLPERVGRVSGGRIRIAGKDVTAFRDTQWAALRGHPVAMVFQDPLSFLNPVVRIGAQIAESVRQHDRDVALAPRCRELLELVKLPETVLRQYPHELSGGMRQRVMLAIALGCRPRLLVADEPTTALDVTTQAEIMALLGTLRGQLNMALLVVSHDLGLLRWHCDRLYIMYAGRTIEWGDTVSVIDRPAHPYTRGLIAASRLQRGSNGRFGALRGEVPALEQRLGCPFAPRCADAETVCRDCMPDVTAVTGAHHAKCWQLGSRDAAA